MNSLINGIAYWVGMFIPVFLVAGVPMLIIYRVLNLSATFRDNRKAAAIAACVFSAIGILACSSGTRNTFRLVALFALLIWLGLYLVIIGRDESKQKSPQKSSLNVIDR